MDTCPWLGSFPWCWHSYLGGCAGTPVWHFSNKPSRTDDPDQIEASLGSQPGPLAWKVSNLERQEKKESEEMRKDCLWVLLSDRVRVSLWQNIKQLNRNLWRHGVMVICSFLRSWGTFHKLRLNDILKGKNQKFKAKVLFERNLTIIVLLLMAKDLSQFLWCQCYIKKKKVVLQYNILLMDKNREENYKQVQSKWSIHTHE